MPSTGIFSAILRLSILPGQPEFVPEPWGSFLKELDENLEETTRLDCIGGFVVTILYGMGRPTADVDVLEIAPRQSSEPIGKLASQGGPLHRKHGVYLQYVGVGIARVPYDYEDRLTEMFPGVFRRLRIMALDPYDLALSKLERNIQRDRDDVRYLARTVPFDLDVLRKRYETELRWQMAIPEREDLTLQLWLDAIREERSDNSQ